MESTFYGFKGSEQIRAAWNPTRHCDCMSHDTAFEYLGYFFVLVEGDNLCEDIKRRYGRPFATMTNEAFFDSITDLIPAFGMVNVVTGETVYIYEGGYVVFGRVGQSEEYCHMPYHPALNKLAEAEYD